MNAKGIFNVDLQPMDFSAEGQGGVQLGRMLIDKQFSGDLEATSKGEMLSARTTTPGSAGYVALEQVTGTLAGKSGSFVLQHFGTMAGGKDNLTLEVTPDSGTGALEGIAGTMTIIMEEGRHIYEFDYSLP